MLGSLSIVVALICAAWIIVDVIRRPQPMMVMNFVWPITALYLGPLAVYSYLTLVRAKPKATVSVHAMAMPMRESLPDDATERRALPFWKVIIVEATHCGAGCTLGDIIAEFSIFLLGVVLFDSRLYTSYLFDFILAYVLGVMFQYFAIVPMRGLTFGPGLWAAIQADTLSLIAFEVGLFSWMAVMTTFPFSPSLTPMHPGYWFLMQIGMIVGYITSYPANWILVRVGIKTPM